MEKIKRYTNRIIPGDIVKVKQANHFNLGKTKEVFVVLSVEEKDNFYNDTNLYCTVIEENKKEEKRINFLNYNNNYLIIRNEIEYIFTNESEGKKKKPKIFTLDVNAGFILYDKYEPFTHPIEGSYVFVIENQEQRNGRNLKKIILCQYTEEQERYNEYCSPYTRGKFINVLNKNGFYENQIYWRYADESFVQ